MINANFHIIIIPSDFLLLYFSLNFIYCIFLIYLIAIFDLFKEHYSMRFSINRSQHSSNYNDDLRVQMIKWSFWIITTFYSLLHAIFLKILKSFLNDTNNNVISVL